MTQAPVSWVERDLNPLIVRVRKGPEEAQASYLEAVKSGNEKNWVTPAHVFSDDEGSTLIWLREKGGFYGMVRKAFPTAVIRQVRPQAGLYVSLVEPRFFYVPSGAIPTKVFATRRRMRDQQHETRFSAEPGFFLPTSFGEAQDTVAEMVNLRDTMCPGMNLSVVFVSPDKDTFLKVEKWKKD